MSGADRNENENNENTESKPTSRKFLVVCKKCRNHDLDDNSLIEIDFQRAMLSYVCRNCGFENKVQLNPPSSNYASIGVGVGRR